MNKYIITWSSEAKSELRYILDYFEFKLKEPRIAKKIYQMLLDAIAILEYFPEGYPKLCFNNIVYKKLFVDKYVIIYQVFKNTRTSLHPTYFPQQSKLFKSIIKSKLYQKNLVIITS